MTENPLPSPENPILPKRPDFIREEFLEGVGMVGSHEILEQRPDQNLGHPEAFQNASSVPEGGLLENRKFEIPLMMPVRASDPVVPKTKNKGGRPRGSKNRTSFDMRTGKLEGLRENSARVVEAAILSGELPVEFMLKVMRNEDNPLKMRMHAAVAAAPYLHPRLAFVQQEKGQDKSALSQILDMMADERRAIAARRERQSGVPVLEHRPRGEESASGPSEQNPSDPPPSQ